MPNPVSGTKAAPFPFEHKEGKTRDPAPYSHLTAASTVAPQHRAGQRAHDPPRLTVFSRPPRRVALPFLSIAGPGGLLLGLPGKAKPPLGQQRSRKTTVSVSAPIAPRSHHVELPPDGGPLTQRRGDLLNERQVARDDRFMLPGEEGGKGSSVHGF